MLTIDEIIEKLKDRNLTVISGATGLSYPTVWRIAKGSKNASYDTVKALSDYFEMSE